MICDDMLARCNMILAAGGARWRVLFRIGLLPRWREVADGTRALVERFAADAEATDRRRGGG